MNPSPQQAGITGPLQQQTPEALSASIFASQLFSDTLKMITPVGQSPNDEQLLVMALQSGLSQGLDHRKAIERLHGVNNHAANLWKDYYLEHKPHIDDLVNQVQPNKTAKKPARFDLGPKASTPPLGIKPKPPKRRRFTNIENPSVHTEPGSSRSNIFPRARGSPMPGRHKDRGSSRHSDLPIPPPPEVEPIPPTKVVKSPQGNLYTVEDKKYFSKYISWALQDNPFLTKSVLIERLAENVPHHTANSWNSYWARDPLSDRLMTAARERATGGQGSTGNGEKEEIEVEDDQETWEEGSSLDSDEGDAATGEHGHFFGAAEMRTMAKYIARGDPPWDHMKAFANLKLSVQHPHRSEVSYSIKYRSKEQEFLKVAERYRRRALRQQRGTPSWANTSGRKPLVSS
ncbi:hypothetical protein F5888DRAFT_1602957 [Russula emetica]|nr:hypothetical protein F5888DRAFT_1602957 [Russula emetica]